MCYLKTSLLSSTSFIGKMPSYQLQNFTVRRIQVPDQLVSLILFYKESLERENLSLFQFFCIRSVVDFQMTQGHKKPLIVRLLLRRNIKNIWTKKNLGNEIALKAATLWPPLHFLDQLEEEKKRKKQNNFSFLILLSTTAIVNSFAKITNGYNWSRESIINSCTCKLVNCDLIKFLL